jgi:hypothetical protein
MIFVTLGVIGDIKNGFENRLEDYQLEILQWEKYPRGIGYREVDCFLRPEQSHTEFKSACTEANIGTLIWGDSHAAALSNGWRVNRDAHQLNASGCAPIINSEFPLRQHCSDINRHIIDVVAEQKYDTVILHAYWARYSDEQLENLPLTITELQNIGVRNIVLIGGVPRYLPSLPSRLLMERTPLNMIEFIEESQSYVAEYDNKLLALYNGMNVIFVSSLNQFCNSDTCKVTTDFDGETVPMAWDYGHLTKGGAIWFSNQIDRILSR